MASHPARAMSLLTVLVVAAACSRSGTGTPAPAPLEEGDAAPGFSLSTARGQDLDLTAFRGRSPVLLYFSMGPG